MSRWRKKPKVIEAERFVLNDETTDRYVPGVTMFLKWPVKHDEQGFFLEIETLEGVMQARPGDWIITGIAGETYPCKHDIFIESYEPAE